MTAINNKNLSGDNISVRSYKVPLWFLNRVVCLLVADDEKG
jgi:hypothetical protein